MLDRILALIKYSQRNLYEVSQPNGNIWFELGASAALRIPTALATRVPPEQLDDLLRSAFLIVHRDDAECVAKVKDFLADPNPPEIVSKSETQTPHLARVLVVGDGSRAGTLAQNLAAAGYKVELVNMAAFGSLADVVRLSESAGTVVAVRPESDDSWPRGAIGQLAALGAAYVLGRQAVLAAGLDEWIPSDCTLLAARGGDDDSIRNAVVGRLQRPGPLPPPSGLGRPRILNARPRQLAGSVVQALAQMGNASLDAEPGYGKTTVASQAVDLFGSPAVWLTLAPNWSLSDLVERIVSGIEPYAPGFGWGALTAVLEAEADSATPGKGAFQTARDTISAPSIAGMLISDAERGLAPGRLLLVIDDVHLASSDCGQFLGALATAAPGWLRILFAGRGSPESLAHLQAQGKLAAWHANELKFTVGETTDFLRVAISNLPDTHVALLHKRTEGWPAALAVIRLWLLAHPDATLADLQSRTRGDRHQIYRIFAAGYFDTLPGSIRDALLELALPPIVTSAEAEYLLGKGGGKQLRNLADGPYFLVEEATDSFRFHSLFREFLEQRWREERGPGALRESRSRMARWYLDRSNQAAAYLLACEAEDWDTAEEAIEPVIGVLASAGDAGLLRSLLERLPLDRIRRSRPILEGWVRALSYTGERSAIEEARRLEAMTGGTPVQRGLARLLLAQLRVDFGELDELGYAREADAVAEALRDQEPKLAVQARQQSLQARSMHNANPSDWPLLADEAIALANDARIAGARVVEALTKAEAADLMMRIFHHELQRQSTALQVRRIMGSDVPQTARVAMARQAVALQDESLKLIQEAKSIADELKDSMLQSTVQLIWARMVTLAASTAVFQSRAITPEAKKFAEVGIGLALGAAEEYAERGMLRNVIIAYNSAAQAAAVISDTVNRDKLAAHAEGLAESAGYEDLVRSARNIRSGPTPLESLREVWDRSRTTPDLPSLADAMLTAALVPPKVQPLVRPVLLRMLEDDLQSGEANKQVCQHLCLVYQDTGPSIAGFATTHPRRRAVCRLRGIITRESAPRGGPVRRIFVDNFCRTCELRSPGVPETPPHGGDEVIYAPLRRRIQTGQPPF